MNEEVKVPHSFKGTWLSNMQKLKVPIEYQGLQYSCVESFYQAMKVKDPEIRAAISKMNGYAAKSYMKGKKIREDWSTVKDKVMNYGLRKKFHDNSELGALLKATGKQKLVENNTWNDTYWGVCNGKGQNKLGEMLMQVREELGE